MGRMVYGNNDFEFKLWFGSQETEDTLKFSHEIDVSDDDGYEDDDTQLHSLARFENLDNIIKSVEILKAKFLERFEITFSGFMKVLDIKGYEFSSSDAETQTEEWRQMVKAAATIELGRQIIGNLKRNKEDLYLDAEY